MSRESVVQLIARKKALYQKQYEVGLQKLSAEEALAYCAPENEAESQAKFLEANAEELAVQLQLNRAQLFGLRFAKSPFPSICLVCFINHGESSSMAGTKSTFGNGFKHFKCDNCGAEVSVAPAP